MCSTITAFTHSSNMFKRQVWLLRRKMQHFFLWNIFVHFCDSIIQRKDSNVQRGEKKSLKMPSRQPLSHLSDTSLIKILRPQVKLILWNRKVLIAVSMLDCLLKEIDSVPGVVGIFDSVNSLFEAATRQSWCKQKAGRATKGWTEVMLPSYRK